MVIWADRIFTGKKAASKRYDLMQQIDRGRYDPQIYLITPASNPGNQLDIYPALCLAQSYYEKKEMLVLGIADGYSEALQLVTDIVAETYEETGSCDIIPYLQKSGYLTR